MLAGKIHRDLLLKSNEEDISTKKVDVAVRHAVLWKNDSYEWSKRK